jgi:hypothetical protein
MYGTHFMRIAGLMMAARSSASHATTKPALVIMIGDQESVAVSPKHYPRSSPINGGIRRVVAMPQEFDNELSDAAVIIHHENTARGIPHARRSINSSYRIRRAPTQ